MIVEEFKPFIEQMLVREPWRDGEPKEGPLCEGQIDWDGTAYWICKDCGRIGTSHVQMHRPPVCTPMHRAFSTVWSFLLDRAKQKSSK